MSRAPRRLRLVTVPHKPGHPHIYLSSKASPKSTPFSPQKVPTPDSTVLQGLVFPFISENTTFMFFDLESNTHALKKTLCVYDSSIKGGSFTIFLTSHFMVSILP